MAPSLPWQDFESAGRAVLAYLQRRLGFALWMLTRARGEDWIVLQSQDRGYGIVPGTVLPWLDTFCARMVAGRGPRIAPATDEVPAYAQVPAARRVPVKAYVGVPLTGADGRPFGTLCAIDPEVQPAAIVAEQELVELLADMLSAILRAELAAAEHARRSERFEVESLTDPLTRLANRRAWLTLLAKEEERCRRFGHSAAILCIDLDELKQINDSVGHAAGDVLITRAAEALREAARETDVVARLGGDEFTIIAVECDQAGAEALGTRVRAALERRQVRASIGVAVREPPLGLNAAWEHADRRMYEAKRTRRRA